MPPKEGNKARKGKKRYSRNEDLNTDGPTSTKMKHVLRGPPPLRPRKQWSPGQHRRIKGQTTLMCLMEWK